VKIRKFFQCFLQYSRTADFPFKELSSSGCQFYHQVWILYHPNNEKEYIQIMRIPCFDPHLSKLLMIHSNCFKVEVCKDKTKKKSCRYE
jgi:hypothetical protein